MIYAQLGNAVSFAVGRLGCRSPANQGDRIFEEIFVEAGDGRGPVHVIVPINEDLFFTALECQEDPVNGCAHVFHQPGVVECAQLRAEKCLGLVDTCGCRAGRADGRGPH